MILICGSLASPALIALLYFVADLLDPRGDPGPRMLTAFAIALLVILIAGLTTVVYGIVLMIESRR